MTLYEIDQQIAELIENGIVVDEDTGEIKTLEDDLDALQLQREEKIENIALYIKNEEALAKNIADEIKTLTERKNRALSRVERLKQYLLVRDGKPLETAKISITYRNTSRVEVDERVLPREYYRIKTEEAPDKELIKKELKNGKEIIGARIVEERKVNIK